MTQQHTKANVCFAFVFSPVGNLLIHQASRQEKSPSVNQWVGKPPTHSLDLWHLAVTSHPICSVTADDAQTLLKTEWGVQGKPCAHGTFIYEQDGVDSTGHLFSIIYDGELTHNTNSILNWQYANPDDMLGFIAQTRIHPISLQAYQALMEITQ